MKIIKHAENIHRIKLEGNKARIALLSDIHWDNPKCDWGLLKAHLDYCKDESIPIHINGDMFCLMQGRGDRRGNKSDIREIHNNAKYLDSIVDTAIDWFAPYAHLITVIGYGNHETAIIKYQETDILKRFTEKINIVHSSKIHAGGYGGWVIYELSNNGCVTTFQHKYFHGSGGGGVVTRGAINLTRALETYEGFDIFSMGHIHENAARNDVRETINTSSKTGAKHEQKQIHLALTGTYKEEYGTGSKGWHVERGAPPKPIGGRILELTFKRKTTDGVKNIVKNIDSNKFPLL